MTNQAAHPVLSDVRNICRNLLLLCAAVLPVIISQPASAQQVQGYRSPTHTVAKPLVRADVETWLDGLLPYALAKGRIAGAVVVVVDRNGPVLAKGYGFADVARQVPVYPDKTLFRPASVAKLLTWTAVMQEVEAGRLDLDTDVNKYLDFHIPPFAGQPVTLRHIMTHTAGFEESLRYLITSDGRTMMPLKTYVKTALPRRIFAPGVTPAYSNYATALAGYLVERSSGMPLAYYIEQRIFQPLGMARSTVRQPLASNLEPMISKGYRVSTGPSEPFEYVVPWPAGSLSATGSDMGRFMIAHLNAGAGLLKPETARLMQDYRAPGIVGLNRMALGFCEQSVLGHRAIGHGGDTTMFHSNLALFPDAGFGIFVSMNSAGLGGSAHEIRGALVQGFVRRYLPAANPTELQFDHAGSRERARQLAGQYLVSRRSQTNFISLFNLLEQAELFVDDDGQPHFPALDRIRVTPRDWVEIAPYVWEDRNTGEKLAAEVKDGKVVQLSLEPVSPFMVYTPVPIAINSAWLLPALYTALALIALIAILWPVEAVIRRYFHVTFALSGHAPVVWRISRVSCWLVILACAGWIHLIAAYANDEGILAGPLDWALQSLRALTPFAVGCLVLSSAWHLVLCFKLGRPWRYRLGAISLTMSAIVCLWVVLVFNLYGFGLVY
jgi:CubicO group peptidase (beta-lactamase class C family)